MPSSGYFDTIFGVSGSLTTVPDAAQVDGSVSYTSGFGILYSTPVGSGGYNFPRAQFNQLMYDVTSAIQNQQQNTIAPFITSAMNGGSPFSYAAGAMVLRAGVAYQSLVAANADTPPTAKWKTLNVNATQSVTGANHAYVAADNNLLTLRSNSGALMIDTLPGTALGSYWGGEIVNNDSAALLQIVSGGSTQLNGVVNGSIILGPGQRTFIFSDGTNYWQKDGGNERIRLGANTTFYVSTTGSDSNNGLASGTPWLTLNHAYNWCQRNVDLNAFNVIVQLAAGTYTTGMSVTGGLVGEQSPFGFTILGDAASPATYIISTTSADAFYANDGPQFLVKGVKIITATSGNGIFAQGVGTLVFFEGVDFGACAGAHLMAQGNGSIHCTNNYKITAAAAWHMNASALGNISTSAITVTITGTPAFSSQFASATVSGFIEAIGTTYTGSAAGTRYLATTGGGINTNGGGATYLPGNGAGTATSPGYYN